MMKLVVILIHWAFLGASGPLWSATLPASGGCNALGEVQTPDFYVGEARKLIGEKKRAEAIPLLEMALEKDPDHFDAHVFLASAYIKTSATKRIEHLRSAHVLRPHDARVAIDLSVALERAGNHRHALQIIDGFLLLDPDNKRAVIHKTKLLAEHQGPKAVLRFTEPHKDILVVLIERINALRHLKRYELVELNLNRLERMEPKNENERRKLARALSLGRRPRTALKHYSQLPMRKEGDYFKAQAYFYVGEHAKAAEELSRVPTNNKRARDLRIRIAAVSGEFQEMISLVRAAMRKRPDDVYYQSYLIQAYLGARQPEKAFEVAKSLHLKNPDHFAPRVMLARAFTDMGRLVEAKKILDGVEENPAVLWTRARVAALSGEVAQTQRILIQMLEIRRTAAAGGALLQIIGLEHPLTEHLRASVPAHQYQYMLQFMKDFSWKTVSVIPALENPFWDGRNFRPETSAGNKD